MGNLAILTPLNYLKMHVISFNKFVETIQIHPLKPIAASLSDE